ncbi:MAG: type II secretion system protein [Tissierellia bacterium]|nr:type II secretion system protein [Tissierellia bacterium]
MRQKKKRAFTLIELIIVVSILALLVAIALPKYVNSRKKAAETAHNANVRVLESAAATYLADEGLPEEKINWHENDLWEKYLESWPDNPYKNGEYSVTIDTDGEIVVTPGIIKQNNENDSGD